MSWLACNQKDWLVSFANPKGIAASLPVNGKPQIVMAVEGGLGPRAPSFMFGHLHQTFLLLSTLRIQWFGKVRVRLKDTTGRGAAHFCHSLCSVGYMSRIVSLP